MSSSSVVAAAEVVNVLGGRARSGSSAEMSFEIVYVHSDSVGLP
jgi:hypothetical protein